mgnify:CR=1 FL=1
MLHHALLAGLAALGLEPAAQEGHRLWVLNSVRVPAGVDDGTRLRLAGEGQPGTHGGPPGDLYVEVMVRKHDIFERDGADLSCEVPVTDRHSPEGRVVLQGLPLLIQDIRSVWQDLHPANRRLA